MKGRRINGVTMHTRSRAPPPPPVADRWPAVSAHRALCSVVSLTDSQFTPPVTIRLDGRVAGGVVASASSGENVAIILFSLCSDSRRLSPPTVADSIHTAGRDSDSTVEMSRRASGGVNWLSAATRHSNWVISGTLLRADLLSSTDETVVSLTLTNNCPAVISRAVSYTHLTLPTILRV